jgi:hypothetical protein
LNFKVPAQSRPQIDSPLSYTRAADSYLLRYLVLAALGVHLAIFLFIANRISSPYSGGGDATIYLNLVQNISAGRGFTFASTPGNNLRGKQNFSPNSQNGCRRTCSASESVTPEQCVAEENHKAQDGYPPSG